MRVCPACGHENLDSAKFWSHAAADALEQALDRFERKGNLGRVATQRWRVVAR